MKNKPKLLLTTALFSASLLAGCKKEEKLYFGFGSNATFVENKAGLNRAKTAVANGYVQTDINFAAVLANEKGVIQQVRLDVAQIKAAASVKAEGEVKDATVLTGKTNDEAKQDTKTKWELLEDYGMTVASPIEKEWYLQAEAFENWVVGKTVEQIKAEFVDYHGGDALKDGETIGVTMVVTEFVEVIEEALEGKVEVAGLKAKDAKLGVGSLGSRGNDGNPAMQDNFTIAGAVFDGKKVVSKAKIDEYQIPYAAITETTVTVGEGEEATEEAALEVTVDKTKVQVDGTTIRSKHDQKGDYNMEPASPIGKEWFEQADSLVAYLEGKTLEAAFVENLVSEKGEEIGCTMAVESYEHALLEAEQTAFNARY